LTRPNDKTYTFKRSEVQRIEVDLGTGNDRLVSDATVSTTVRAGAGNDVVETGPANDEIFAGEGNDVVHANDADDKVFGEGGNDLLDGGAGNDMLAGNGGADVLLGGPGNDALNGGDNASRNQLFGQAGDDAIDSFSRDDVVSGGDGRDSFFIVAGTRPAHDGEDVTIATPSDQLQTDRFSCGPNTGSRFLRSYGIDVSYHAPRRQGKAESGLFRFHLGTRPSVLEKVLKGFKSDLTLHTKASLQDVLDGLADGKPEIALIAKKSKSLGIGGKFGLLHYVVLNGFDLDNQTIRYVGTDGIQGSWPFSEFTYHGRWLDPFKGFLGKPMKVGLEALGLRKRTFLV